MGSPAGGTSRHALIIANDSYQDPGLKRLRAPAQDAVALAEVLGDPRIGGFDVRVMRNEPAHVISLRVDDFFSDRKPGDTLVLHFSCHGLKSETGELFFAAPNTLPRRLASTAVAADFVRRCMATTRARSVVLLLDCCYGGAFSQGPASVRAAGDAHVLDSFAGDKLGGGRGWAVITASNAMEYAFEGADLAEGSAPRPSVFTRAVVQGLATGEADLDEDGRVSLDELYEYVFDHVRRQNPHQTPGRTVDMQGDMYLARSHRRRIVPSPVPDDVRAAMRSPDIYTRRGAIAELRARMENRDLSVALGAREALEEMAHRDIRAVADEASRALGEVAVNPHPARLDFGWLPQHTSPPHRTVRLLGPPLARSCAPHAKGERLRVRESADTLDVWVDTSSPGPARGEIVLKGAVGEAVLHVEAEVVPAEAPRAAPPPQGRTPSRPDRETAPPPAAPAASTSPTAATAAPPGAASPPHAPSVPVSSAAAASAPVPASPPAASPPTGASRPSTPPAPASSPAVAPASSAGPPAPSASSATVSAPAPTALTPPAPRDTSPPPTHPVPSPPEATRPASREAPGAPPAHRVPPPPPRTRRHGPDDRPTRPHDAPPPPPQHRHSVASADSARRSSASPSVRAPVLAAAGLALAVLAGCTIVMVAVRAVEAVRKRVEEPGTTVGGQVAEAGVTSPLVICLLSAFAALVLAALARHDAKARPDRSTASTTTAANLLTGPAKWLATPSLVLAVMVLVAYFVTRGA